MSGGLWVKVSPFQASLLSEHLFVLKWEHEDSLNSANNSKLSLKENWKVIGRIFFSSPMPLVPSTKFLTTSHRLLSCSVALGLA